MLTFEQFVATRKWSDDLTKDAPDYTWTDEDTERKPAPRGWLYMGSLIIEQVQPEWPNNVRDQGEWYLLIANEEWISNDRDNLERKLFDFALSAGYGDDKPEPSTFDCVVQYASDGEQTGTMWLHQLIENFDENGAWHNKVTGEKFYADDMRHELASRGWYEGIHDFGRYLVLNLDKLSLQSKLELVG